VIKIDADSAMPLHAQIAEAIQLEIARGTMRTGQRLPTVRQLSVDLAVNSNTVARVYQELERLGIVETRRGQGTFVALRPPDGSVRQKHLERLCAEFVANCAEQGYSLRDVRRSISRLGKGK